MFFRWLLNLPVIKYLIELAKKIRLPGFQGLNIYDVSIFFFGHLAEREVQSRARSIAFSFFLALFPGIIFLFSLIPYVPIKGFQDQLLLLIQNLLPPNTYEASRITIEDIIKHQRGGLLSFGVLFTLYVSSNGINSLINAFNQVHRNKRSPFKQRVRAVSLTLIFFILVIFTLSLLIFSEVSLHFIFNTVESKNQTPVILVQAGKWIILIALCFIAVSILYYFGTIKKSRWRFISAGSTLATLLILLTSLGFNYFVIHFASYNKVYGSIGTLIIILLWIYFNCMQLIVGYELNASIDSAKKNVKKIT
ncbi:MAG TPA: YihY/virulence factor BrkB family protein [Bacteroidia bacterium]|nr:YihY/virulence factor BrkB family protein [Bacteroidia bacterium]